VKHEKYEEMPDHPATHNFSTDKTDPNQFRWQPMEVPTKAKDGDVHFIDGLRPMSGYGDPMGKAGLGIYLYAANADMGNTTFYSSDGDLLIVPQMGRLHIRSEMGNMMVEPCEIVVMPRGVKFSVDMADGSGRGYVLEVYGGHFTIPDLGPIGANGLANPRDFVTPVASYVDEDGEWSVLTKYGGIMFQASQGHCPYDVVAWHGNYAPYKYDLRKFNCMNSVTFDHPDPSIYTVLTCPTDTPGVAACDFVIFPPRWMVMEHSFRPPYYHRNIMSEYMGMIYGAYDAKVGFVPGGSSLHSCMTPHGPDAPTFLGASTADLKPEKFDGGLAFMFESTYMLKVSKWALEEAPLDKDYAKCWQPLPKVFDGETVDCRAKIKALKAGSGGGEA
jgi:homogentisate 1,2-dioxygenase